MKKRLLLSVAALLVAIGAGAQSRAVDRFATAWDGAEGVSVVSIKNINANIVKMDEVGGVDIANFIKNISSIIIVSNERTDEEFTREMNRVVDEGDYTEIVSVSQNGERVKILSREMPGGDKELIITVIAPDKTTLISTVGDVVIKECPGI